MTHPLVWCIFFGSDDDNFVSLCYIHVFMTLFGCLPRFFKGVFTLGVRELSVN